MIIHFGTIHSSYIQSPLDTDVYHDWLSSQYISIDQARVMHADVPNKYVRVRLIMHIPLKAISV